MTTLGTGVDGAVRRVEIAYDGQGNAFKLTNYDAATAGNVVNQIQREFNGLGQMTKEFQEHAGAVNTGTSLKVQYAYSEMSWGANHSRLTSMTYPNAKVLTFNYSTGLNDSISRLSSLSDSTGTLESYDHLGLATVVRRAHSQPGVDLTYIKLAAESTGDAGDQYTGLDRFGRIADQRWIKTSDSTHRDRFQYGHDRNGNRLYRDSLLNNNFDELYHANGASNGYDLLNQLTDTRRGALSDTNADNIPDTVTTASRSQGWAFDALGNFSTQTTDGNGQNRTHNKQNEITSIAGATTPTYDANGNLTKDETGRTFEYDAWNRLARVKDSGGATLVSYKYDAANRRIQETKSGTTTDFYYSSGWQVLEERVSGSAKIQYVWSPVYVDAMILRDRDADGNGSLEERLWVAQDANFNVTALLDNSGNVVERFALDAYGLATFYDANWNVRSTSSYGWVHLHQSGRYETLSGLYLFGIRNLSPTLGRWTRNDPIGPRPDSNLYRYEANAPTTHVDPTGLIGVFFGGTRETADETKTQTIPYLASIYDEDGFFLGGRQGPAKFFEVPGVLAGVLTGGIDPEPLVSEAYNWVTWELGGMLLKECKRVPVDIFGLSRGGIYAVLLARKLDDARLANKLPKGTVLRFLGVIDPVSTNIDGFTTAPAIIWGDESGNPSPPLRVPSPPFVSLQLVKNPRREWRDFARLIDLTTHPLTNVTETKEYSPEPDPTMHQAMGRYSFEPVRKYLKKRAADFGVKWQKMLEP